MRVRQTGIVTVASSLALGIFATHAAAQEADLSACGNMYVAAEAKCEYVPKTECIAQCTPVRLEAACAADLSVMCDGQCNVQAEASCNVDCSADCKADCTVDPGSIDCSAECRATCGGDCKAQCAGGNGGAHCEASCEASCAGSCNAKCDVVPPSASCEAKCDASCSGSCEAKANVDCQVDCQAEGYASCEVMLKGGCELECTNNPDGGLFCDGQFVKSQSVDDCLDALEALLDVEVVTYAEGSGSCVNGKCMSSGKAGASCSALPGSGPTGGALASLFGLGAALVWRRRRAS